MGDFEAHCLHWLSDDDYTYNYSYAGHVLGCFAFGHVKWLVQVLFTAIFAFVARDCELSTSSIDDNRLLLRRLADKQFNIVISETCVSIYLKCMLGKNWSVFNCCEKDQEKYFLHSNYNNLRIRTIKFKNKNHKIQE